jgi:hypothetical protein
MPPGSAGCSWWASLNRTLGVVGLFVLQGNLMPCAQAQGFASLQALIAEHDITTVEGLLHGLPEPLRAQYTLVFQSRSLQGATYANPRVILFGNDATLVLTFNGDPAERGYDAVESMEFDGATESFRLREIQFGGKGAPPTVSEANPPRCGSCHGSPARPIWDTPPSWPGVYGERYLHGLSTEEAKGIRAFLAIQPMHPRFRSLIAPGRFGERGTYVTSSAAAYNGRTTEPPNAQLSSLLTRLNTRTIVGRLVSSPGYASHQYVLLAAAEGDCGPLEDFYPRSLREALRIQLREYLVSHAQVDARQDATKSRRLGRTKVTRSLAVRPADMGQLRFVVERGLAGNTDSWTLALESNTFDLAAPPGAWTVREALLQKVATADNGLAELHEYRTFTPSDEYCRRLAERSRQALEEWFAILPTGSAVAARDESRIRVATAIGSDAPPAVRLCVTCHTGEIAPLIPFGNPQELAVKLRGGNYAHGHLLDEVQYRLSEPAGNERMPQGTLLATEEIQALKSYFIELANLPNR